MVNSIAKEEIQFLYKANYLTSHAVSGKETEIWVVLHGYGQLAEFFLKKFSPLFAKHRLIIAPEATNYGYLKGFSGRVGANWMTSHERDLAINNNYQYLNKLLDSVLNNFHVQPQINILGFSQGAATATRWVTQFNYPVHKLVLWGGGFAHDMALVKAGEKLKKTYICIALGDHDEFITEDGLNKQEEFIQLLNLPVNRHSFPGGHELNLPLLTKLFEP